MNRFLNKQLWGSISLLLLSLTAEAQTSTAPTPPFVNFPADYGNYTVEIKSSKPAVQYVAGSCKELLRVDVLLATPMQKRVNSWNDQSTTEDWVYKGTVVAQSPYGSWLNTLGRGSSVPLDASGFSTLSAEDYKGNEWYKNVVCFRFEKVIHMAMPPGHPEMQRSHVFWINSSNKLPVAVDDGVNLYLYTFREAKKEPLVLPEKYRLELIKSGEDSLK